MENFKVNVSYAKALFALAEEQQCLAAVAEDMRLVCTVFRENHQLMVIYRNPGIPVAKKVAIINELFEGKVSRLSMLFLTFVVKKNRVLNVMGIANAYIALFNDHEGIVRVDMQTAVELPDGAQAKVEKIVGDYTGRKVELHHQVTSKLIGGFLIEFDNKMVDARVRTLLERMRREFSSNAFESQL